MSLVKILEEIGSDCSVLNCESKQQQATDLLQQAEINKQWCIILLPAEEENDGNTTEKPPVKDRESQGETISLH